MYAPKFPKPKCLTKSCSFAVCCSQPDRLMYHQQISWRHKWHTLVSRWYKLGIESVQELTPVVHQILDNSEERWLLIITFGLRSLRKSCIHIKIWLLILGTLLSFFILVVGAELYRMPWQSLASITECTELPWSACITISWWQVRAT